MTTMQITNNLSESCYRGIFQHRFVPDTLQTSTETHSIFNASFVIFVLLNFLRCFVTTVIGAIKTLRHLIQAFP